ncbi:MAG: hypothetical protein WCI43_03340 [Candidatus Firestonebacteria bacterium]
MKYAAAVAIILAAVNYCFAEPLFELNYIVENKFFTCNKEQVVSSKKDKKLTLVLPAGTEGTKLSIDIEAMKKGNWAQYNTFLSEIENTSAGTVSLKLRFIRRAIDDRLIQDENPLYDRVIKLLPGKNAIKIEVGPLSGSSARGFMIENIIFDLKNDNSFEVKLRIKDIQVLSLDDE